MKMILKNGKRKVLTLSYDDGVVQDKRLVRILDKNGIKCTFNINTGMYSEGEIDPKEGHMTRKSSIDLLKNSNHEVAVHGYTHPFPEKIDSVELINQIIEDRKNIERDYGVIARGMAYPYGRYNDGVIDILKKCHIDYSRTVKSTFGFDFPDNWLTLHPTCHHNYENLMGLAEDFVKREGYYKNHSMMFYLWGHSYEFDNDNNWDVIEEFTDYMGKRSDIWYATNIEIFDYVKAYKSLYKSVDGKIIHNPSSITVWFEIDEKIYSLEPAQTLII